MASTDDLLRAAEGQHHEPDGSNPAMGRSTNHNTFPFLSLPRELQVTIYCEVPNLWTAISLRQVNREVNELYLSNRAAIFSSIRDKIIGLVSDFYAFHVSFHMPDGSIRRPPPEGWPQNSPRNRPDSARDGPLVVGEHTKSGDRSDFAFDVLRHLPYMPEILSDTYEQQIAPRTHVIDYSEWCYGQTPWPGRRAEAPEWYSDEYNTRHWIPIFAPTDVGGHVIFLDALNCLIYEETSDGDSGTERQGMDLKEYFDQEKEVYRKCLVLFVPGEQALAGSVDEEIDVDEDYDPRGTDRDGPPSFPGDEMGEHDGDFLWVRHLYRKFGWPGENYRKEECLKAIEEFKQARDRDARLGNGESD